MKYLPLRKIVAGLGLLMLTGCSDGGTDPVGPGPIVGGSEIFFAADVQPLFTANCTGCHGQNGNGGLDLRAGFAYDNLVEIDARGYDGQRVVRGFAERSVLYLKMSGAAGVGNSMPPSGPLPASATDIVRQWINEGAAEN